MATALKSTTKRAILPCTCKHDFQDEQYGKGMRLHRVVTRAGAFGRTEERCTVCFSRPHRPGGHGGHVITLQHRYLTIPTWLPSKPILCR